MENNKNGNRASAKRNQTGENGLELAEEQKSHQEHLRRLRKYKKKHKQQIVGLVLELLLLVVVIGGYFAVSWTEGILNNMQIDKTTAAPPTAQTLETRLPDGSTDVQEGTNIQTVTTPTPEQVSWTNTDGVVITDTMPPVEPYTNPLERRAVEAQEGYWTIACFGVDARDNSTLLRNAQGDVCIIMTINKENGEIRLASVYRDFFFEFASGQFCKLTDAYNRYGAEQVMAGLNRNLDLNITDFITINWKALADVVDLLGGLDIEVSEAEARELDLFIYEIEVAIGRDTHTTIDYEAGVKHLDGIHVVAYSRIRHNTGSDFARTERQRKVISIILERVKDLVKTWQVGKVMQIVELVSQNIKTNMDSSTILQFATSANRYSLTQTTGFPMHVKESPHTYTICSSSFSEDVKALHEFLYSLEDYEPSDNVKRLETFHNYSLETGNVPIQ